jgi:glycosyltransferase involved in cell wall biosynthesis
MFRRVSSGLAGLRDKRIVLISHDLYLAGSQLLLIETASRLREAGAHVRLVTLGEDARPPNLATRRKFPVLSAAGAFEHCVPADLVVANTAVAAAWVDSYLERHPAGARSLVWWIHEIDAKAYADRVTSLQRTALALFDSQASLKSWTDAGVSLPSRAQVINPCVDDEFMEKSTKSRFPFATAGLLKKLGVRTFDCTRAEIRERLGIAVDDLAITVVGNLLPEKGQALFMNTVTRLLTRYPRLPLKVIMVAFRTEALKHEFLSGLDTVALKALDARRAVLVTDDLTPYYAAGDAFLMNSQHLGENFGRVTIEAMTFRLPVLGTEAGGTCEIVERNATGLFHPVGVEGQDKLAENILTFVENRAMARAMGEAGRRRVQEKFTMARFNMEFGSAMQSVLDRSQPAPRERAARDDLPHARDH